MAGGDLLLNKSTKPTLQATTMMIMMTFGSHSLRLHWDRDDLVEHVNFALMAFLLRWGILDLLNGGSHFHIMSLLNLLNSCVEKCTDTFVIPFTETAVFSDRQIFLVFS